MSVRVQITLDPELRAAARKRAAELGVSFAEYVRRLVAHDLGEEARSVSVERIFALGGSGGSDIARDKDEMLGRAVAELTHREPVRR